MAAAAAAAVKRLAHRNEVANEILTTERDYVAYLNATIQVYAKPLSLAAENRATLILTQPEIDSLFLNIEQLYITNVALLKLLEARLANGWTDDKKLGDIFMQVVRQHRMNECSANEATLSHTHSHLMLIRFDSIGP